ncbi:hypothetical protein KP1_p195 (plasmid) [Klebsiella pneumoniae subsp. pneumoniae NTUH-K2044]|uniref:Uncharacterized protein n=1 Tax=Klebsiella pneumoniae CG43 TaxID=1244085 RepID=Q6U5J5_KLEPN|nr:hypothetical protein LV021 [Klebsiella pneumoniae CG43]BAH66094.1 hypothetical protein KP1_p195 [Klebsiella pneumoniae subsp. pneumoniae NTUH-K2044]
MEKHRDCTKHERYDAGYFSGLVYLHEIDCDM